MLIIDSSFGYFNIREFRQNRPSCISKEVYEQKMCDIAESIIRRKEKECGIPDEFFVDRDFQCCSAMVNEMRRIERRIPPRMTINLQGFSQPQNEEETILGVKKSDLLLGLVTGLALYFLLR